MLVPATRSTGTRCSSSHRMTPMWARPRALPPPKATPIRGRANDGRAGTTVADPMEGAVWGGSGRVDVAHAACARAVMTRLVATPRVMIQA